MKLLFIINSLGCGGAERNIVNLALGFKRRGYICSFINLDANVPPFYKMPADIEILNIRKKPKWRLLTLLTLPQLLIRLRRKIKKIAPDLIISFMDQTNLLSIAASLKLKIPIIVSEQIAPNKSSAQSVFSQLLVNIARVYLYPFADALVCQTQSALDDLKTARAKINKVIRSCLVIEDSPKNNIIPQNNVVACGRLVKQKRFDMLIKAFSRISSSHPDWNLLIYGEGPLNKELAELIDGLGLKEHAYLMGTTSSIHDIFRSAKIFVLSSDYEGFPNVLCEALACGCACISTNCPYGPAEIIQHQVNGLLIETGNEQQLAGALTNIIENPNLCKLLGINGKEIITLLAPDSILGSWEDLIKTIKTQGHRG